MAGLILRLVLPAAGIGNCRGKELVPGLSIIQTECVVMFRIEMAEHIGDMFKW